MPAVLSAADPGAVPAASPASGDPAGGRPPRRRLHLRRRVLRHRRLLAALAAGVAVGAAVLAATPPAPTTVAVLVPAEDLPAGTTLTAGVLERRDLAPGTVPAGTDPDPTGQVLATPVRAGEPVTDVRVLGDGLLAGHRGLAAVPVRIPDPGAASLLSPGMRIDVHATDPATGTADLVASDATVIALPAEVGTEAEASGGDGTPGSGTLVLLGVPEIDVASLSAASAVDFLTVSMTH